MLACMHTNTHVRTPSYLCLLCVFKNICYLYLQAIWLYEGDAFLQCLLAFSDKNMPELKTAAEKDGTGYTLQVCVPVYIFD